MSMVRVTSAAVLSTLLLGLLAACSSEDEIARDAPTTEETAPVDAPDDGGFAPSDYDFTMSTSCFCVYGGVPVRVSVRGDTVTSAVFERGGGRGGAVKGEEAPDYLAISIEDMLEQAETARDEGASQVRVEWPDGADHPTEIYIDRDEMVADEELGWTIRDVEVLG